MLPNSVPQTGRLAGKVAFVTGAASGIGRATALLLAEHGATVTCADVNFTGAEETVRMIAGAGGKAWPSQLNVTSEAEWVLASDQVIHQQNQLDIVVNCAGISAASPLADTTLDEWRRVFAVNLDGVFLGTKHAIRVMRGHTRAGSIVNVASISGIKAQAQAHAYCSSKAAVIMLSKTAALECLQQRDSIRVNSIAPSGVKTLLWQSMPFFQDLMAKEGNAEAAFRALTASSPHGRFAEPEEIAQAILYLASDESRFVNGTTLVIDNGYAA